MCLASTPGIKIKLIAHEDLLETINQKFGPTYFRFVIPKETYTGMTQPVSVIATGNFLVVHEKMDEKVAYGVVKTLFDHRDELIAVHKEAEKITLATAANESGIPFHPGAIKFYREKNAWKEK